MASLLHHYLREGNKEVANASKVFFRLHVQENTDRYISHVRCGLDNELVSCLGTSECCMKAVQGVDK